jgi:hypothetical protein
VSRFRCSDPEAGDFTFDDIKDILDALEAALISADMPLFDSARQSWQRVGFHPEVRSAWEARERYRPPGGSILALPTLPAVTTDDEELARRRAAFARVRSGSTPLRVEAEPVRKRKLFTAAAVLTVALLAIVGLAIVTLAVRLTGFAAAALSMPKGK